MSDHAQLVGRYYDATWQDQRLFWANSSNLAIHMGYWDKDTKSHGDSLNNVNRVMAELAGIRSGDRVLDAGCGVGGPAIWLAANYGASVMGITVSRLQLDKARKYARKQAVEDRARFELRDFTDTGFDAEQFDVVWAQESVAHAEDKGRFFAEAYRVLKPGGRIIVEDFFLADANQGEESRQLIGQWTNNMRIPHLTTAAAFEQAAAAQGFLDIEIRDVRRNMAPSFDRYKALILLDRLSAIPRLLGLRKQLQVDNSRAIKAQTEAFFRGYWYPGIVSARKSG